MGSIGFVRSCPVRSAIADDRMLGRQFGRFRIVGELRDDPQKPRVYLLWSHKHRRGVFASVPTEALNDVEAAPPFRELRPAVVGWLESICPPLPSPVLLEDGTRVGGSHDTV